MPLRSEPAQPSSWSKTERLPYPKTQSIGKTWLEGNAVVTPKGKIADVLRVDDLEKAAIVLLQNGKPEFQRLVDFPGGAKKFTIRYDRRSKRYWALSNAALPEYPQSASNPASVRNTLVLISSKDLEALSRRTDIDEIRARKALPNNTPQRYWNAAGLITDCTSEC